MKCCICGKEIKGWGNSALPIMNGQCCDDCNRDVIAARVIEMNLLRPDIAKIASGFSYDAKVGMKVYIAKMLDEHSCYNGVVGTITHIDAIGQLHGTWGGCALIPNYDIYYVFCGDQKLRFEYLDEKQKHNELDIGEKETYKELLEKFRKEK